ncbi:hypothetical protein L198_04878 [Cryptococcus wingfieldii CBS 7118]|uniref:SAP domain-containing protein n=1 Tax=Cryptococcus wingfieldii CBS 7118 TaxID=1295528 RepID=A0A1E3J1M6_9TREE|nr:hypothetical protein L198_04878 [Cryptococcus wingfieldii CBS 7118]ODN94734.1 hypothetical protein L198_04878 [Cryptococcus wingfieldii CBS 7118]
MDVQLQKLKVTDLKEILSKASLPQTGKKDDLIKRIIENNLSAEVQQDELTDPDAIDGTNVPASAPEATTAPGAPNTTLVDPTDTTTIPPPVEPLVPTDAPSADSNPLGAASDASAPEPELTADQKAMKARAERFGVPLQLPKPKPAAAAPAAPKEAAPKPAEKQKAGAIDKNPLGYSDEVLARRTAKFGAVEKKTAAPAPAAAAAKPEEKAPEPVDPEAAAKLAAEEEKKRKRLEKFAAPKSAETTEEADGSTEPDAKKVKV